MHGHQFLQLSKQKMTEGFFFFFFPFLGTVEYCSHSFSPGSHFLVLIKQYCPNHRVRIKNIEVLPANIKNKSSLETCDSLVVSGKSHHFCQHHSDEIHHSGFPGKEAAWHMTSWAPSLFVRCYHHYYNLWRRPCSVSALHCPRGA